MRPAFPSARVVVAGVAAGLAGGISIWASLAVFSAAFLHQPPDPLRGFAFTASVLIGPAAFTLPFAPALGVVLHFVVAVGWALGYAVLAQHQRELRTRPVRSGAGFGLVVYFAMQLVLVAAGAYRQPTPASLGVALLAHLAFYGIPVALIVRRLA